MAKTMILTFSNRFNYTHCWDEFYVLQRNTHQNRKGLGQRASFQQWGEFVEFISSVRLLFDKVYCVEDKLGRYVSWMRCQRDLCRREMGEGGECRSLLFVVIENPGNVFTTCISHLQEWNKMKGIVWTWPAQEAPWGTLIKWRLICPDLKCTSLKHISWWRLSVTLLEQKEDQKYILKTTIKKTTKKTFLTTHLAGTITVIGILKSGPQEDAAVS